MARLKVFLDGQLNSQHELSPGQDFVAGRGESCDCVLRPERGISRQHFRVWQTESGWEIESLSRFGELYVGGEKIERTILQPGQMFSVPPYEFHFDDGSNSAEVSVPSIAPPELSGRTHGGTHGTGGDERTVVGPMPSAAILRLVNNRGEMLQTFSLQGSNWVAGRDISCSIFIDNAKISRKQFEVQKTDETFFVRDLRGINGTLVNGSLIPHDQWTQLQSSDVISIADCSLVFEIRDLSFEQRVSEVDAAFRAPVTFSSGGGGAGQNPYGSGAYQDQTSMPAMYLPQNPKGRGASGGMSLFGMHVSWLNPLRLGILVIVIFSGAYYYMEGGGAEPPKPTAAAQTPFDKLPIEKQQVIKQAYQLARDLYMTGRFELARQKIEEIHAVIPYYEDTQDLLNLVDIAISTQRDRDKLLAQQEDEKRRMAKVKEVVEQCRVLIQKKRQTIVLEEIENCVQPALEFDPQNADIESLRKDVDYLVQERAIKAEQAREFQHRVEQREKLYKKAQVIDKSGRPLTAIEAYLMVVRSQLPDPNNRKTKSQRRIASIEKDLRYRQGSLLKKAEAEYKKGNRKGAIQSLKKAIRINPGNPRVEDRIAEIVAELRKDMQPIYHEGILEESVGNVDTARQKFTKIMEISVPGEEYYDKAKMKMKKYGQ